jgi:hypothetical protein
MNKYKIYKVKRMFMFSDMLRSTSCEVDVGSAKISLFSSLFQIVNHLPFTSSGLTNLSLQLFIIRNLQRSYCFNFNSVAK